MKTFIATIRIKGQLIRTTVAADDAIHAKLLLQFLFGMNSIAAPPAIAENSAGELPDAEQLYLGDGLIKPISSTSPKSPEKAQLDALKVRKDQATQALKAARQRINVTKAQKALHKAMQPIPLK